MYYLAFAVSLLMPLAMLVLGLKWCLKPPAYLSDGLVYRTSLTEKSEDIWLFAHVHCGKLWYRFGFFALVISIALLLIFPHSYQKFILWVLFGQAAVMCVTIFMIEVFLKNLFDENGTRIH